MTDLAYFVAGFFYFFGITGVTIGWFVGHWLHDAIGRFYQKRHGGRIDAEARLIITYPATFILGLSILILGFAVQYHWHYMVLAVFASLQCVGIMVRRELKPLRCVSHVLIPHPFY